METIIGTSLYEGPNMTELDQPETVPFQLEYVTLLGGDVQCALMLSQLVFWHMRGANPDSPLRVFRDGLWWIAVSWRAWQHNLGFSNAQTRRCLTKLLTAGLLDVKVYKFDGTPTRHVRLPWLAAGETLHESPTAAALQLRIAETEPKARFLR